MTVLVTGGTGFVGPHIVHALRARGLPVRALVRDRRRASRLEAWGVELAVGDVGDAAALRAACEGAETVVHLVAIIKGSRSDFERVMAQGTRNLVAFTTNRYRREPLVISGPGAGAEVTAAGILNDVLTLAAT